MSTQRSTRAQLAMSLLFVLCAFMLSALAGPAVQADQIAPIDASIAVRHAISHASVRVTPPEAVAREEEAHGDPMPVQTTDAQRDVLLAQSLASLTLALTTGR